MQLNLKPLREPKINWKRGGAELIGIALAFPLLCAMIIMAVGVMQTGITRQSLEYANYMGARAAVTADNYETARTQAASAVKMTLNDNTFGVDIDNVSVNIDLVAGTTAAGSNSSSNGITWEKGALAKCETVVPYKSLFDFQEHQMKSTLYVMVEKPAKTFK